MALSLEHPSQESTPGKLFPLFIAAFCKAAGLGASFLAIPLLAEEHFNTTPFQLALIMCIGGLVLVISCPLMGWLSDRGEKRYFILAGCFSLAITYALMSRAQTLFQFYLLPAGAAFSSALFWPALEAEIARGADAAELRRRMGVFNICWSAGNMFGLYLGGALLKLLTPLPFLFGCALELVIIAWLLSLGYLRARPPRAEPPCLSEQTPEPAVPTAPGPRTGFMLLALVAHLAASGVVAVNRGIFPDLATVEMPPDRVKIYVGALLGTMGAFRTVTFFLFKRWHWWTHRLTFFFGMQVLLLASALSIASQNSFLGFMPAFIVLGISSGMIYFYSIFHSIQGEGNQGLRAGVHEAFLGLGGLVVPLVAGIAPEIVKRLRAGADFQLLLRLPYLTCGAVIILSMMIQVVIIACRRMKGQEANSSICSDRR